MDQRLYDLVVPLILHSQTTSNTLSTILHPTILVQISSQIISPLFVNPHNW